MGKFPSKKKNTWKKMNLLTSCQLQFIVNFSHTMCRNELRSLSRSDEIAAKLLSTLPKDSNKKKIVGIVV